MARLEASACFVAPSQTVAAAAGESEIDVGLREPVEQASLRCSLEVGEALDGSDSQAEGSRVKRGLEVLAWCHHLEM